jgi:hypothetical protein
MIFNLYNIFIVGFHEPDHGMNEKRFRFCGGVFRFSFCHPR